MSARLPRSVAGALTLLPLLASLAAAPIALATAATAQAGKKTAAKPDPKAALPGGAKLVESFGDWGAYTAQSGRAKLCYALAEPKSRSPANLKDTKAYLFVSFRPADKVRNEVAAVLNFKTKDKGPGTLAIGDASYDLITMGENAWVKTPGDEAAAIERMVKGSAMTVQVVSARGNKTSDRYSLAGFGQALERAKRECP